MWTKSLFVYSFFVVLGVNNIKYIAIIKILLDIYLCNTVIPNNCYFYKISEF